VAEGKIKGTGARHLKTPVCTSGFTCTRRQASGAGETGQASEKSKEDQVQAIRQAWRISINAQLTLP